MSFSLASSAASAQVVGKAGAGGFAVPGARGRCSDDSLCTHTLTHAYTRTRARAHVRTCTCARCVHACVVTTSVHTYLIPLSNCHNNMPQGATARPEDGWVSGAYVTPYWVPFGAHTCSDHTVLATYLPTYSACTTPFHHSTLRRSCRRVDTMALQSRGSWCAASVGCCCVCMCAIGWFRRELRILARV